MCGSPPVDLIQSSVVVLLTGWFSYIYSCIHNGDDTTQSYCHHYDCCCLVTYLDCISSLVSSEHQVHSLYFYLSCALDLVWHPALLHILCVHELPIGYINRFYSNFNNQLSSPCILGTFSLPYEVFWRVPQGSVLGLLLFSNIFNDLSNVIKDS